MPRAGLAELVSPVQFEKGGVQIFRRDAASSYGWWGNLAVVLGRQPPEAVHVANYRACVMRLHERHPQGIGLITVVKDTSTPSPGGREAMIAMFKEIWPMMDGALFIPDATGFKAAVLRSVMGCVILATGQRDRVRVEASVAQGIPWLASKLLGPVEGRRQTKTLCDGVLDFCAVESARPEWPLAVTHHEDPQRAPDSKASDSRPFDTKA